MKLKIGESMEIDRTVQITLSKVDIEELLQGYDIGGDGYTISLSIRDFGYSGNWKLVRSTEKEKEDD